MIVFMNFSFFEHLNNIAHNYKSMPMCKVYSEGRKEDS